MQISVKELDIPKHEFGLISYLGRCKSAFHEFLTQILEKVADRVEVRDRKQDRWCFHTAPGTSLERYSQKVVLGLWACLMS